MQKQSNQFATIPPYYNGNGRTAKLLTTLILHLGSYNLKSLYSLKEYHAQNLDAYYEAISIGLHKLLYRFLFYGYFIFMHDIKLLYKIKIMQYHNLIDL